MAGGPPSRRASDGQPTSSFFVVRPARWLATPDSPEAVEHGSDVRGGQRYVVGGLRIIAYPDGTLEQAEDLIPSEGAATSMPLPDRLGGGFLFYVTADESPLWRSSTWTGRLEPLKVLPLRADDVVAGFDRLYVAEQRTREVVAFDLAKRRLVGLHPLPPAPAYGSMAFVDGWFGAVQVPYRGVLVSFDAGDSWHPVNLPDLRGVGLDREDLVLHGEEQDWVIESDGKVRTRGPVVASQSDGAELTASRAANERASADLNSQAPTPRLRDALRNAVLYGWPDTATTAIFAQGRALARVRLRDGKVLDYTASAFGREEGNCTALPVGNGFGFVCTSEADGTSLYRFAPPLGVKRIARFVKSRSVLASGNGALVIQGSCSTVASGADARVWCVRHPGEPAWEIPAPRGVRAVALTDHRAALLEPPTRSHSGTVAVLSRTRAPEVHELVFPERLNKSVRQLLKTGLWLDGVSEAQGKLSAWVVGSDAFAGVRVNLDGRVAVGKPHRHPSRTLLAGPLALTLLEGGTASESTDGGFEWSTSELPVIDVMPTGDDRKDRVEQGCSRVGCAVGSWLRVGWNVSAQRPSRSKVAGTPQPAHLPRAAGGRWLFECVPTGVRSPARDAGGDSAGDDDEADHHAWGPLYNRPPPPLGTDSVGFLQPVASDTSDMRIVAWGPRGASWKQRGKWQLWVAPFDTVTGPVWSTTATRSPWGTESQTAEIFARSSASSVTWSAQLDPTGRAGVLRGASGTGISLYLFEEGRSISPVLDSPSEVSRPSGAVKVLDRFYFGVKSGSEHFRIYEVIDSRAVLYGEYAEVSRRLEPQLVRDNNARSLAIWAKDRKMRGAATTWYVYPIDSNTHRAGQPLVLQPRTLGARPSPCPTEAAGWVLEGEPPLQPVLDLARDSEDSELPRGVRAQLLASVSGVCLDGLTGRVDGGAQVRGWPTTPQPLPDSRPSSLLVVTDVTSRGRRWEFRCLH